MGPRMIAGDLEKIARTYFLLLRQNRVKDVFNCEETEGWTFLSQEDLFIGLRQILQIHCATEWPLATCGCGVLDIKLIQTECAGSVLAA